MTDLEAARAVEEALTREPRSGGPLSQVTEQLREHYHAQMVKLFFEDDAKESPWLKAIASKAKVPDEP